MATATKEKPPFKPTGASVIAETFNGLTERQRSNDLSVEVCWAEYRALIRRLATDQPKVHDATMLGELIDLLDLSQDQVQTDVAMMRRASEFEQRAASRKTHEAEYRTATSARDALEKRHREEMSEVVKRVRLASSGMSGARNAEHELDQMRRRRPQLFGDS